MSQNNAKQLSSPSRTARRQRQRQRKRAITRGAAPPQKSVQQPVKSNQVPRRNPRRGGRGQRSGNGPLGSDFFPGGTLRGSVFQTMDPFGSGWEEKSGMLGAGNTRSVRRTRRDMVIEESEFIAAVTVANQPNFNNQAYSINPGNSTTFPWLATIAKQFEKYQFEKLAFIYKKEVSEFATAGQTGKVMMSVDFDASDPPPASKQQIEDSIPHADAMPCQSFSLVVDSVDLRPVNTDAKYVRTAGLPGSADIKTYDVGNLNIATQGIAANSEIGELHVAYRIRLMKPVLESAAVAPVNNSFSVFTTNASEATANNTTQTVLFATPSVNGAAVVNTAGSFVPPPGNYLVDWYVSWNGTAITNVNMNLQKNSVDYLVPTAYQPNDATPTGDTTFNLSGFPAFVSANGTDAFRIRAQASQTGAGTLFGVFRWTLL